MSYVTNVVIWVSLLEIASGDDVPAITFLNEWLQACEGRAGGQTQTLRRVDEEAGGTKHINCYLYAAGVNFLPLDEFMRKFHDAPWKYPEMNMLVIRNEDQDIPVAYYPGHRKALTRNAAGDAP